MRLLNTHLCLLSFARLRRGEHLQHRLLDAGQDKLTTCAPGAIETGFGDQDCGPTSMSVLMNCEMILLSL